MKTNNCIPDICEFGIRIEQSDTADGRLNCVAELRVNKGELRLGGEECEVSILKATISVDVEGLEVVPGTRYGEPIGPNNVPLDKTISQTKNAHNEYVIGGESSVGTQGVSVGGSVGGKRGGSSTCNTSLVANHQMEHLRVKAIPNLKWEVREVDDSPLMSTFLNEDNLLGFKVTEQANRSSLNAVVSVKQRDLTIEPIMSGPPQGTFFNRLNKNQKRLLDIFIAKSLSSAIYQTEEYQGEIKLSEHASEIKDEE